MTDDQRRTLNDLHAPAAGAAVQRHAALPPPASCPIPWQPAALTPVFYGVRSYAPAGGAPLNMRVFFPSLDGAVFSAPILAGCDDYPVILFAHGHCEGSSEHYKRWFLLPAQLARSGYVVVVPELPSISLHPSHEDHPALPAMDDTLDWLRASWEHRHLLRPAGSTGIVGHSYGALLAARFASSNNVAAYASLSGVWEDWSGGPLPLAGLDRPMLFIWGNADEYVRLSAAQWNALARPRHRIIFEQLTHWDYLSAGSTPCNPENGPCRYMAQATADFVTTFFAKYLPPRLAPDLPNRIPNNLVPPPLTLTHEQEFYAGSYLYGLRLQNRAECAYTSVWATDDGRTVPLVRQKPRSLADQLVRQAGLTPKYTGATNASAAWVFSQSPAAGALVEPGSVVTMNLRTGSIP